MLSEEVSKFIGKVVSTSTLEVEKGAIQRFAEAVDDPNPLYRDEEYARSSRYGSIIAPPGFFGWPVKGKSQGVVFSLLEGELEQALTRAGYNTTSAIDGGITYEFFQSVRAGDSLTASLSIKDIAVRRGPAGRALFIIYETTYTNQNGDQVAKERGTFIYPGS